MRLQNDFGPVVQNCCQSRLQLEPYLYSSTGMIFFLSFILCNFLLQTLQYIFQFFFAHKKLKKPPQKVAYLWQSGGFFLSSSPTAQNSPDLHFRFIHSFIQPSLVGSLDTPSSPNNLICIFLSAGPFFPILSNIFYLVKLSILFRDIPSRIGRT